MAALPEITVKDIKQLVAKGTRLSATFVEGEGPEGDFGMYIEYKQRGTKQPVKARLITARGHTRYIRGCRSLINFPRRLGIKCVLYQHTSDEELGI